MGTKLIVLVFLNQISKSRINHVVYVLCETAKAWQFSSYFPS